MKPSIVNKTLGNSFEEELCELFKEHGCWAHNMAQNETGQPADVIASKNNCPVIIDCKVCSNDRFSLSRIEGNQEGAMTLWEMTGNTYCYFAMKLTDGSIHMVDFDSLSLRQLYGEGSLQKKDIEEFPTFEEWLVSMGWM